MHFTLILVLLVLPCLNALPTGQRDNVPIHFSTTDHFSLLSSLVLFCTVIEKQLVEATDQADAPVHASGMNGDSGDLQVSEFDSDQQEELDINNAVQKSTSQLTTNMPLSEAAEMDHDGMIRIRIETSNREEQSTGLNHGQYNQYNQYQQIYDAVNVYGASGNSAVKVTEALKRHVSCNQDVLIYPPPTRPLSNHNRCHDYEFVTVSNHCHRLK